jgi:hypothetical protein
LKTFSTPEFNHILAPPAQEKIGRPFIEAKKQRTAEYRTAEPQKAKVKTWNPRSSLLTSAVRMFCGLLFLLLRKRPVLMKVRAKQQAQTWV